MKTLLAIMTFALALSAQAHSGKFEILDVQIGLKDYSDRPTLCVTVLRSIESGELVGLVEDITDCFYARKANRSSTQSLELPLNAVGKSVSGKMLIHLQGFDPALQFLWSNHE